MKRMVFAAVAMSVGMAVFAVVPVSAQRHAPPGAPDLGPAFPRSTCLADYNQHFGQLTEAYRLRAITYEQFNEGVQRAIAERDACLANR